MTQLVWIGSQCGAETTLLRAVVKTGGSKSWLFLEHDRKLGSAIQVLQTLAVDLGGSCGCRGRINKL